MATPKSQTAMAAPRYIEIPLRTNKAGAGMVPSRHERETTPTPASCLTGENTRNRERCPAYQDSIYGIRGNSS
ncbi:hypothetical protein GCM10027521_33500 [Amycolatopsis cihanbeyliensis]